MTKEEFTRALKEVDWADIHYSYGPARDVPDLLLALFEDIERVKPSEPPRMTPAEKLMLALRNPAALPAEPPDPMGDLFHCLCHQGDIYPATVAAVPFLIELLRQQRASRHHEQLLYLLQSCLGDWSRCRQWAEQQVVEYGPAFRSKPSYKNMMEQAEWGEQAQRAALEGLPVYLSLVSDQRPKIRIGAAAVIRCCGDRSEEILPYLHKRLNQELEPIPWAGLLLAIATLCRESDSAIAYRGYLLSTIEDATIPSIVRLAAILGYAETGPDRLPVSAQRWLEQFREDAAARETDMLAKTSHTFEELAAEYEELQAVDNEGLEAVIQRLLSPGSLPTT